MKFIRQNLIKTLEQIKRGNFSDIWASQKYPTDEIISFALKQEDFKKTLNQFTDPRKLYEVPIDIILLSHIVRTLNNEHSFFMAPYLINDAEILSGLAYNANILRKDLMIKIFTRENPPSMVKHLSAF